jgi:hypothetical protein
MKTFRNKVALWEYISIKINKNFNTAKTKHQVCDKYKNVMAVQKNIIGQKRKSGAGGGKQVPF